MAIYGELVRKDDTTAHHSIICAVLSDTAYNYVI